MMQTFFGKFLTFKMRSACIVAATASFIFIAFANNSAIAKKLSVSNEIISFDVSLSSSSLKQLKRLPYEFNFEGHKIWTDSPHLVCAFTINRRPIENRRIEMMAQGRLTIQNGIVRFQRNNWRTRGMSDPSYLEDEGNLRILENGTPIGKIPYFHLFINQGEVARPPLYVELTKAREKGEAGSPEGLFSFYVDDWQEGLLTIRNCTSAK